MLYIDQNVCFTFSAEWEWMSRNYKMGQCTQCDYWKSEWHYLPSLLPHFLFCCFGRSFSGASPPPPPSTLLSSSIPSSRLSLSSPLPSMSTSFPFSPAVTASVTTVLPSCDGGVHWSVVESVGAWTLAATVVSSQAVTASSPETDLQHPRLF